MAVLIFIALLVGLIILHELGHFAVAKLFNIRVDEFGIFFPPRLGAIKRGETEYSINLLPFGGFVRIFGENPTEEGDDPRSFARKPRLVQAAVVVAGIVANALVAWLLVSAGYMAGLPTSVEHEGVGTVTNAHPEVVALVPNSPAQKAGIEPGDIIEVVQTGSTVLDVRTLNTNQQAEVVRNFIGAHPDESLVFTVLRQGVEQTFLAKAAEGVVNGRKAVGIELDDVGTLRLPPHLALYQGALLTKNMAVLTAEGLGAFVGQLVVGRADLNQVSGPIGIVSMGGVAVHEGFATVIVLVASISIALALFNLVPIPGLDGGRLLIIAIEGITRRRVPSRVVFSLTLAGMGLLILLMVVVSLHDISKLVG